VHSELVQRNEALVREVRQLSSDTTPTVEGWVKIEINLPTDEESDRGEPGSPMLWGAPRTSKGQNDLMRCARSAHRKERGVTLKMLVAFVEQVSVDLGASLYIATSRTQSLHAYCSRQGAATASRQEQPRRRADSAARSGRERKRADTPTPRIATSE